jgi:holo-[acyl-carrier protein] synthase
VNVGIDIEEVERFAGYIKDKKRLERIFSKEEILYSLQKRNASQHLAVRFAAKEAVWKALSAGNRELFAVSDISVRNDKNGRPQVYIKNKRCKKVDVSLSHTKKYVVAVAVAF